MNTRVRRYAEAGLDGLFDQPKPGKPAQVSGQVRARILALTRMTPPAGTGLSHWSSREMARYLMQHEGIDVSHNFIADLWRANDLQPHRTGTFKVPLSSDANSSSRIVVVLPAPLGPRSAWRSYVLDAWSRRARSTSLRHLSALTISATFDAAPPDVSGLPGVSDVVVTGREVTCQVRGSVAPVLRVLAAAGPLTLLSREPSLEELFLSLYGGQTTQPDAR